MSAGYPFEAAPADDEVIDAIAAIEMLRRETEKKAGRAMSCRSALQGLNELLDHETEALRLSGPDTRRPHNIEAVTRAIARVQKLASVENRLSFPGRASRQSRKASRHRTPYLSANSRGRRRTMGRSGGR